MNPQRIQQACDILSGKEKEEVHVTGIIVKSPAPYNPGWTFHYEPESISFLRLPRKYVTQPRIMCRNTLAKRGQS